MSLPRPIFILGPTAGGKSSLAVEVAERADGEVISADSMQVYRELDAGTAKPSAESRRRVPHHLVDIVDPTEPFTVADWLDRADPLVTSLREAGRTPVVVGGTNLYVRALLEGLFDGPPKDEAVRQRLEAEDPAARHRRLAEVDPEAADRIHVNDTRRVVRALEVFELTDRPISDWQRQWEEEKKKPYRHDPVLFALRWPTKRINHRINKRVRAFFYPEKARAEGLEAPDEPLPAEVRRLEAAGRLGTQARQALGYKQVLAALAGDGTLDEAFEQTKIETRRFARQQRTWLKRFRDVRWLDATRGEPPLVERVLSGRR